MDNEAIYNKLLEVSIDIKVTRELFEDFTKREFKQHQDQDNRVASLVHKTAQRINRIYWSVGSCLALVAFVEGFKAFWH